MHRWPLFFLPPLGVSPCIDNVDDNDYDAQNYDDEDGDDNDDEKLVCTSAFPHSSDNVRGTDGSAMKSK